MKKASKTQIARTYALSLYEAAVEKNAVAQIYKDIEILSAEVQKDAQIVKYLANPLWNLEDKKAALETIAQKLKLAPATLNCLDLIADNNRFGELPQILSGFREIYNQKNGIEEVQVESVKALSAGQHKKLLTILEKNLQKKVIIKSVIDPAILGGLRIKYGSSMIDDSIDGKLNRLEIMMKGGR